jgi:hypothetical protein
MPMNSTTAPPHVPTQHDGGYELLLGEEQTFTSHLRGVLESAHLPFFCTVSDLWLKFSTSLELPTATSAPTSTGESMMNRAHVVIRLSVRLTSTPLASCLTCTFLDAAASAQRLRAMEMTRQLLQLAAAAAAQAHLCHPHATLSSRPCLRACARRQHLRGSLAARRAPFASAWARTTAIRRW